MALPSIQHKLNELIKKGMTEESHVVYFLTQIRKIIEIRDAESSTRDNELLKFFVTGHYILG